MNAPYDEKPEALDKPGRCSCGLHPIPAGIAGVQWYWARHSRSGCLLELPDKRCWCGLLRSQHQTKWGHARSEPHCTCRDFGECSLHGPDNARAEVRREPAEVSPVIPGKR